MQSQINFIIFRRSFVTITIRQEVENDHYKVEELTREAFWNLYKPGCDEHYLLHTLRSKPDFIQDLDYVAEIDEQIVGSIIYTRSYIVNENNDIMKTVTFGPICVHPKYQRSGIGTKLIEYTKDLVVKKGFPVKEKAYAYSQELFSMMIRSFVE